ncbi:MAG: type IV pilus modification PilV family protein, partial [Thermoguttaceae bacterium]
MLKTLNIRIISRPVSLGRKNPNSMRTQRKKVKSSGFSLIEILVALSVLLLGLAVVIRLTTIANRESTSADELATVQLACQTLMNELLATNIRPIPTGPAGA